MDLYAYEQLIERLDKIQDDLDLVKEKFEINDEEDIGEVDNLDEVEELDESEEEASDKIL